MWHEGDRVDYAMYDPASPKTPVVISEFPAAVESICRAVAQLREHLQGN